MDANRITMQAAFLIGPSGKITGWNAMCEALLGYPEREVMLHHVDTLLSPAQRAEFADAFQIARNNAEQSVFDLVLADGRCQPFRLTLVPQYRKTGRFNGFSVILTARAQLKVPLPPHNERQIIRHTPLKSMINYLTGTFYVLNQQGQLVLWNKRVEAATRLPAVELDHIDVLRLFDDIEKPRIAEKIREVFEQNDEVLVEANLLAKNDGSTPFLFSGARFRAGETYFLCGTGLDISERRKKDEQLRLRERALHASSNGLIITRCAGKKNPIEYVNPAFERITGYSQAEVLGRDPRFMAARGLDNEERARLRAAIANASEVNVVFRNRRKNGDLFWNDLTVTPVLDEKGVTTHFIGVINDITSYKHHTSHLEHKVSHDVLTGLANRMLLWDRLEQALHAAQRNKKMVATLLIDLDNFKVINDSLGHDAGDAVLRAVAQRLQETVRDSDTVARLGGDEFVLVLSDQPSLRFTLRMIERLRQHMAKPVVLDGQEIAIEFSLGVSVFPHDGTTVDGLMQAADAAMYHAKRIGRNGVHFFSEEMKMTTESRRKFEDSLRNAMARNEIYLAFQPKVSARDGAIMGAEALLRWRHPERGILLPDAFLAEAEDSGLIVPVGQWVAHAVCATLARLQRGGFGSTEISMNVSLRELLHHDFFTALRRTLAEFNLAPERFELEIKESYLAHDPGLTHEILPKIKRLGIRLTIDEFGAGLSLLRDLPLLPIDYLKMSRSLLDKLHRREHSTMARTLIGIGHSMNIAVVADGVETGSQFRFLQESGCDQIQGNYLSEPVGIDRLEQLLAAGPLAPH